MVLSRLATCGKVFAQGIELPFSELPSAAFAGRMVWKRQWKTIGRFCCSIDRIATFSPPRTTALDQLARWDVGICRESCASGDAVE